MRRDALDVTSSQYAPVMANFAVRLVHGPGWDPSRQIRDQDGWDEHAEFMDGLVDDGFIILGGPVGDGEQTLHAVEAADENEIRVRLGWDPWAAAGLLQIGTIESWALWLDSRPANRARLWTGSGSCTAISIETGPSAHRSSRALCGARKAACSTDRRRIRVVYGRGTPSPGAPASDCTRSAPSRVIHSRATAARCTFSRAIAAASSTRCSPEG
jgi:uncharacterized protein YciI